MRKKIYVILFFFGLITLSCDEMQINPSEQDFSNQKTEVSDVNANGAMACALSDAIVKSITITNITGNTFQYDFTVTNLGATPLPLNEMLFETHVSMDDQLDYNDPIGGGAMFLDTAPTLGYGESYSQHWYYSPSQPSDITVYHFLIIKLIAEPTSSIQECSLSNNTGVQDIVCKFPDGWISNISIAHIDPKANTFDYTFTVTNLGGGQFNLNQMFFQTYLSNDPELNNGDPAAGGAYFGSNAPALGTGDVYTQAWYYHPATPVDLSVYRYFIVKLLVWQGPVTECNTDNNVRIEKIIIPLQEESDPSQDNQH